MHRTGGADVLRSTRVEQAMGITELFRADGVFLDLAAGTKTDLLRVLSAEEERHLIALVASRPTRRRAA